MLVARPLHPPMDLYAYKRHDPDGIAEARDRLPRPTSRAAPPSRQQQQLPSLREVVLPALHTAIDSAATEASLSNRLPQLQTTGHPPTGRPPGSTLSSPIHSQTSSMPDSFDELGQKNYDSLNHFNSQKPPNNWPVTSSYQEMATTYATRQPYYHQSMGPLKHEPGLPPIRDMPFTSPTIPSPSYNNVFNTSPQGPLPMDYSASYRRQSYNDSRALSQTYPPYARQYSMDKYEPGYRSQPMSHQVYSQPFNEYPTNYHTSMSHGYHHSLEHDRGSKKRRGNLPKPVTDILRQWLLTHMGHPYPTEDEKQQLIDRTGLSMAQISNWFINARRRHLPAMKEKAQQAEKSMKAHQDTIR